jgi:hypothetical protein
LDLKPGSAKKKTASEGFPERWKEAKSKQRWKGRRAYRPNGVLHLWLLPLKKRVGLSLQSWMPRLKPWLWPLWSCVVKGSYVNSQSCSFLTQKMDATIVPSV